MKQRNRIKCDLAQNQPKSGYSIRNVRDD